MTEEEYANVGRYIVGHLEKLMSGEYRGHSVICPLRPKHGGGICRITIDMPTDGRSYLVMKDGSVRVQWEHFTWVPDEQAFVNSDFVYKAKTSD